MRREMGCCGGVGGTLSEGTVNTDVDGAAAAAARLKEDMEMRCRFRPAAALATSGAPLTRSSADAFATNCGARANTACTAARASALGSTDTAGPAAPGPPEAMDAVALRMAALTSLPGRHSARMSA